LCDVCCRQRGAQRTADVIECRQVRACVCDEASACGCAMSFCVQHCAERTAGAACRSAHVGNRATARRSACVDCRATTRRSACIGRRANTRRSACVGNLASARCSTCVGNRASARCIACVDCRATARRSGCVGKGQVSVVCPHMSCDLPTGRAHVKAEKKSKSRVRLSCCNLCAVARIERAQRAAAKKQRRAARKG
jgi:hypothetical protein